jgi:hypothetical protein
MLRLCTAGSLPEAHLLRELLAQAGIAAHVLNASAQGGMGEIPFTHAWPELWLERERDEQRARALVREWEHAPSRPDLCCASCGEINPGSFDLCWHCGAALA